jgi:hypothetical protein
MMWDLLVVGVAHDHVGQEGHELLGGVASRGLALALASFGVERGVEREGAVSAFTV